MYDCDHVTLSHAENILDLDRDYILYSFVISTFSKVSAIRKKSYQTIHKYHIKYYFFSVSGVNLLSACDILRVTLSHVENIFRGRESDVLNIIFNSNILFKTVLAHIRLKRTSIINILQR